MKPLRNIRFSVLLALLVAGVPTPFVPPLACESYDVTKSERRGVQALWLVQGDLIAADTELGLAWARLGRAIGTYEAMIQ